MNARPLYLGGKWRHTGGTIDVVNPANGETLARVCTIDRDAVAEVIADAHRAFAGWRALSGKTRGEYLRKIADELERRSAEEHLR